MDPFILPTLGVSQMLLYNPTQFRVTTAELLWRQVGKMGF